MQDAMDDTEIMRMKNGNNGFYTNYNDWHYQNMFVTNNVAQCRIFVLLD